MNQVMNNPEKIRGYENVPREAVKYRLSKKLGCWVRTWFTVEKDEGAPYFQQHIAFAKDKNVAWDKWSSKLGLS